MLTPTEARSVLYRMAEAARGTVPSAWAAGAEFLAGCDSRTWLLLDGLARRWSVDGGPPVTGARGWLGPSIRESTGFVVTVTSWHTDGRVRQRATEGMRDIPGLLTAKALALRALDPVGQVRVAAQGVLAQRTALEEIGPVLGVLLHAERRYVGPTARDCFLSGLLGRAAPVELVDATITSRDPVVRRWAYRFAHEHDLPSLETLLRVAAVDPDQVVRRLAAEWLAPVATASQLRRLMLGRSVDGRLLALSVIDESDLAESDLLGLLCDRSPRVRRTARWRAEKRGLDVSSIYRSLLAEKTVTARQLAAAIDALGDTGSRDDAALVRGWIEDPRLAVRVSGVLAFAALSDSTQARATLIPLLMDPSPRVTAAVARGLRTVGVPLAETQTAWEATHQPWSRRAAWLIRRTTSSWGGVVADLEAANDSDEVLRRLGTRGVQDWIRTSAASTYRKPTEQQIEAISRLLPHADLHPDEARMVAFHAGMQLPGR